MTPYQWIGNSWKANPDRKNGGFIFSNSGLQFFNATLSETTIPACDATLHNEPGLLNIKLKPMNTRDGAPTLLTKYNNPIADQKLWLRQNYRLEIDGLDSSGVIYIAPFTVTSKTIITQVGSLHEFDNKQSIVEFPNLKIILSEAKSASWKTWHSDFVIKGDNSDAFEKNGILILLAADGVTEIMRVNFFNVGIYKLDKPENGKVGAEIYCERMELDTSKTGLPSTPVAETVKPPNGPGKFGETYNMRKGDPLNFSIKNANYSVAAVNAGEIGVAPLAREKLLVLHFTVTNPQAIERLVRWDMLRISAQDAAGLNYTPKTWGLAATGQPASLNLAPGKSVELYTMIAVPARGEPATIMVKSNRDNDGPELLYTINGQVPALASLPEPFADPADLTGASALEEVAAIRETAYPYEKFTVAVEKIVSMTTSPMGEVKLKEGEQFLVCSLLVKNQFPIDCLMRHDMLQAELTGIEGELMPYKGMLLETTDRPVAQLVHPGDELRVRLFFIVPQGAKAKYLTIKENKSRRYRYQLNTP